MPNINRANSDFSITEKLHDFIRNYDWQLGYQDVVKNNLPRDSNGNVIFDQCPGNSSFWYMVSSAFEDVGSELYQKVANFVPAIADPDVCSLAALNSLSQLVGIQSYQTFDASYPLEIKEAVELFSMPKAKVFSDPNSLTPTAINILQSMTSANVSAAMGGYISGWVNISGDVWQTGDPVSAKAYHVTDIWTDAQYNKLLAAQVNNTFTYYSDAQYLQYIEDSLSGILVEQITNDGIIDDFYSQIYTQFVDTPESILDTPSDTAGMNIRKKALGVPLKFFVRQAADNLVRGTKRKSDFSYAEWTLIEEELSTRSVLDKFGDQPDTFRRYRYEKERKVRDYIRFIENINLLTTAAGIESYGSKYDTVSGDVVRFFDKDSGGNILSGSLIENATHYLRNISIELSYQRQNIKTAAQKHQMIGTSRIFSNIISEYLAREFKGAENWRLHAFPELSGIIPEISGVDIGSITSLSGGLFSNTNIVEYADGTDYLNISATVADALEDTVNTRFWEGSDLDAIKISSEHTAAEVSGFYENIGLDSFDTFPEMETYLAKIYNTFALSATTALNMSDVVPDHLSGWTDGALSGMYLKYLGAPSGDMYWANHKNVVHPTIAPLPFLWALQRVYNSILGLDSIFYPQESDFASISGSLSTMFDENGAIIDLWRKDNRTFTGYEDEYEYSFNQDPTFVENAKIDVDGPFYFPALSAYLENGAAAFSTDFNSWYDHISDLDTTQIAKIKDQLTYYETDILSLSAKVIYQYGVDKFGNQYTLYKDNREFDTSGALWMRYKDHPISFPLTDPTLSLDYSQLDVDSFTQDGANFELVSTTCYDFGLETLESTNILWMYGTSKGSSSQSGQMMFGSLSKNDSVSTKNKFTLSKLSNNSWYFDLEDEGEKHIGSYVTNGDNGRTWIYVTRPSFAAGHLKIKFRSYDNTNGWASDRFFDIYPSYSEYEAPDGHNAWKIAKYDDSATVIFESASPFTDVGEVSSVVLGSNATGPYDATVNYHKNGYHNGLTTIDFPLTDSSSYPSTYQLDYFTGYNDLTYQSIQAWEGLSGNTVNTYYTKSDNTAKLQFLGASDPSTTASFIVRNEADDRSLGFQCTNTNDEYLLLGIFGSDPTWDDLDIDWDSMGDSTWSTASGVSITKTLYAAGDRLDFSTELLSGNILYSGLGCHNFVVTLFESTAGNQNFGFNSFEGSKGFNEGYFLDGDA